MDIYVHRKRLPPSPFPEKLLTSSTPKTIMNIINRRVQESKRKRKLKVGKKKEEKNVGCGHNWILFRDIKSSSKDDTTKTSLTLLPLLPEKKDERRKERIWQTTGLIF